MTTSEPPSSELRTEHLFGLDFVADASIDDVVSVLIREAQDDGSTAGVRGWRTVVTPNVDHLVRYRRDPAEEAVAREAMLVLPDGMPIVWASRLLKRPLASRLPGSDLFPALWPRLAELGIPAVVVAPSEEVARRLEAEHPRARCVVPPFFAADDPAQVDAVVDAAAEAVEAVGARLVFVAISVSKTHVVAARMQARWSAPAGGPGPWPVVLLVGAAPEFHLGIVERAPGWAQRWGLEWLYRLAKEPRRMARRYLVDDVLFVRLVWDEWRSNR
jgi:N-acetylglucosaminyldiphosphoundecaprenol N-acetyl-beta-D-mannosaminyltransferase